MQLVQDTPPPALATQWLEAARATLSRLPLDAHDVALRTLIADWSRRHTGGERLATNPAWEAFDAFVAEDRDAEREAAEEA